LNFITPIQPRQ